MTQFDKLIDGIRREAYSVLFDDAVYDEERFLWAIDRDYDEACLPEEWGDIPECYFYGVESIPSSVVYGAYRASLISARDVARHCDAQDAVDKLVEEIDKLYSGKPLRKLCVEDPIQQHECIEGIPYVVSLVA
jgi:hypothetical protein